MKGTILLLGCLGAALVLAPFAWAEAPTGFGIAAGVGSGDYDFAGTSESLTGAAVNLDFQFGIGDMFSLGPLYQYFYHEGEVETGLGTFDVTAKTSSIGLLALGWFGNIFAGGHISRYNTTFDAGGGEESDGGSGFGVRGGWEADGGFFAQALYDSFSLDSQGGDTDVSTLHLLVGFRFK